MERLFGIVKKRFYALATILRVRSLEQAAKMVQCAFVLHNLCLMFGDDGDDLDDVVNIHQNPAAQVFQQDAPIVIQQIANRRQELLHSFV